MLTVFVSLRELPRYPNEAFTICLSPIIHLVCPSNFCVTFFSPGYYSGLKRNSGICLLGGKEVVLKEMYKCQIQCRSAGVTGAAAAAVGWGGGMFQTRNVKGIGKPGNLLATVQKEAEQQQTGFCYDKAR